jgi:hypothetical protein
MPCSKVNLLYNFAVLGSDVGARAMWPVHLAPVLPTHTVKTYSSAVANSVN